MKNTWLAFVALLFLGGCATLFDSRPPQQFIPVEVEDARDGVAAEVTYVAAPQRFRVTAPSGIVYTDMQGFFVRNTAQLSNEVNYFIATNERMFLSVFGVARTLENVITIPDFENNIVLSIVLAPSRTQQEVIIRDVEIIGSELIVRYSIASRGSFPHTTVFFRSIEIERPRTNITTITFDGGRNVVRVPFAVPRGR